MGVIGSGCTAVLATQSSTKVYGPKRLPENQPQPKFSGPVDGAASSESRVTHQSLIASVANGGLLAVLSDPVTLYAGVLMLHQTHSVEII